MVPSGVTAIESCLLSFYKLIRNSLDATMAKEGFVETVALGLGFEEWTEYVS